jgi:hypothetical protein
MSQLPDNPTNFAQSNGTIVDSGSENTISTPQASANNVLGGVDIHLLNQTKNHGILDTLTIAGVLATSIREMRKSKISLGREKHSSFTL